MYIFWYKTTVFIQNLYILVKFFGKNFIFSVKSTNFLVFQDQMLVKFFGKNFIFSVKSTFFFVFFRTKCTFLGTKLHFLSKICTILVKFFSKNFIFRVKSTNFLVFQDQMYIFGYKTTVFIQNLYILVKYFGKNFIFSVKSTIFCFLGTKCTFLGTKLHFLSKICTF